MSALTTVPDFKLNFLLTHKPNGENEKLFTINYLFNNPIEQRIDFVHGCVFVALFNDFGISIEHWTIYTISKNPRENEIFSFETRTEFRASFSLYPVFIILLEINVHV